MKKNRILTSILLVTLIGFIFSSCGDKMYVNKAITWAESGEKLDTALKSVDKATELEETKDWAKTYYAKGYVYQSIYEKQKQKEEEEEEESEVENIAEKPLFKAFDNYKKAYNMKDADKVKGSVDAQLFQIKQYFTQDAVEAFKSQDFGAALDNFEYALNVSDMPLFEEQIDTAIIYNAGIAAQQEKEWEKAAEFYSEAAEHDYEGAQTYALLQNAFMQTGDTTKAVEAMKEGFEKYPDNEMMVQNLVNHYLVTTKEPKKALKYLDIAIEKHPEQPQYYSAKGQIFDETGDTEKAKKFYKKALELNSDEFLAAYNLGVIHFNRGVDTVTAANKIRDEEKYEKMKDKADEYFLKAIPYLEKAYELKSDEKEIANKLKTLYYRLRDEDEEYVDKYKQMQQKIEMMDEE
ncbi:MAG: tetratricopeptide repeat protein [Bacteroidota bacterium]